MKKMNTLIRTGLFCMLCSSASAMAFESDITVNANVDPSYGILMADGTPLPESINMTYAPGVGLSNWQKNVTFYTNIDKTNINLRLKNAACITDPVSMDNISLTVSVNGQALSTTDTSFNWATLFPKGVGKGATLPLTIAQDTKTTPKSAIKSAGQYSGVVTLVMTKGTTVTPPPPSS